MRVKTKLSEVFNVARGGSPRPIQDFITESKDGINWIMIGDTEENEKYITKTAKKIRKEGERMSRKVYPGDFLLTNSMSFGRPYIVDIEGCIHDGWLVLSPKNDKISQDYFYYLLGSKTIKEKLIQKAAGAVVKNLNSEMVRDLEIFYDPLDEQKAIAEKLDKADALRKKDQELLKYYDELAQSVFIDMFGDPVKNEKGWEVKKLDEVCNKITDGTHDTPQRLTEGIKFITGKHIKPFFIDFDNSDYVTEDVHNEIYRRCNPEINDVLYTNIGVNYATAAMNIVDYEFSMKNVALLKFKRELLNGRFLEYLLNDCNFKDRLKTRFGVGGAQQFLSLQQIKSIGVLIPPLSLQQKFANIIENIEEQKKKVKQQAQESENLFQALLQESFS